MESDALTWQELEATAPEEAIPPSSSHSTFSSRSNRSSLSTSSPRWRPPSPIPSPPPVSTIDVLSLPQHVYHPQPPSADAIRLVRLRAADPERPGVPVCSLETAWLDLHPPYCAVSYSWGPPEDVDNIDAGDEYLAEVEAEHSHDRLYVIVLDGQVFGVRRNLLDFLVKMSTDLARPSFVGYDLFWIDAICIDQYNLDERNRQVNMMAEIYREAHRVLVWLGTDIREEMEDVKNMVDRVIVMGHQVARDNKDSKLPRGIIWKRHVDQKKYLEGAGLPPFDDDKWWPFCAFFRRSWFFRFWVMQEVAIAKEIVMLCGDTSFEFLDLDDCGVILRWGMDLQLGERWAIDRNSRFRPVGGPLGRLCQVLRWCQLREEPYPGDGGHWLKLALNGTTDVSAGGAAWNLLLEISEDAKCSQAIDKVFALIGIVQHLAPQAKIPVVVNYAEMEKAVQLATMKYILTETQWLNTMCRVVNTNGQICIPSWAPQLGRPTSHSVLLHSEYNASLSLSGKCVSSDVPMFKLVNHADILTSATKVSTIFVVDQEFKDMSVDATENLAGLLTRCDKIYKSTGEVISRAVWKSLVVWPEADNGPCDEADRVEKSFYAEVLYEFAASLAAHAINHFDFNTDKELRNFLLEGVAERYPNLQTLAEKWPDVGFPSPDEIVEETLRWNIEEESRKEEKWQDPDHPIHRCYEEAHEYRFLAGKHAILRRFFRTEDGYVGLGPDAAREGDEVWLIPRTTVPIVLRRVSEDLQAENIQNDYIPQLEHERKKYSPEVPFYVVVGEAYVHGIMHGEFLTKSRADAVEAGLDWSWQDIVISFEIDSQTLTKNFNHEAGELPHKIKISSRATMWSYGTSAALVRSSEEEAQLNPHFQQARGLVEATDASDSESRILRSANLHLAISPATLTPKGPSTVSAS